MSAQIRSRSLTGGAVSEARPNRDQEEEEEEEEGEVGGEDVPVAAAVVVVAAAAATAVDADTGTAALAAMKAAAEVASSLPSPTSMFSVPCSMKESATVLIVGMPRT